MDRKHCEGKEDLTVRTNRRERQSKQKTLQMTLPAEVRGKDWDRKATIHSPRYSQASKKWRGQHMPGGPNNEGGLYRVSLEKLSELSSCKERKGRLYKRRVDETGKGGATVQDKGGDTAKEWTGKPINPIQIHPCPSLSFGESWGYGTVQPWVYGTLLDVVWVVAEWKDRCWGAWCRWMQGVEGSVLGHTVQVDAERTDRCWSVWCRYLHLYATLIRADFHWG
ncbi:hypothetical protein JB92DRAFT_2832153 [Gautieria morchelliformis]|nr:hypothetical protein JB92DRAFT_2832153 [Gautieria morchelliformis]